MIRSAVLVTLVLGGTFAFEQEVLPHCGPDETVCEFKWKVTKGETMIQYDTMTGRARPVYRDTSTGNDVYVARNAKGSCNETSPLSDEELEKIATADGRYRTAYFINGQFPGPNLVVFQGQQVVVRLTNALLSEGVSVHWHGIHQRGTPWMDGVAGVTQCPINPSETFTYRFLVNEAGTFWYHSHLGLQRTDGLFGFLVVLPRTSPHPEPNLSGTRSPQLPPRPAFDKDYLLMVHDWFGRESSVVNDMSYQGLVRYWSGYDNLFSCYSPTLGVYHSELGSVPFETALINGKGSTRSLKDLIAVADTKTPNMERFRVRRGGIYRFRVINPSLNFAFQINFGGHKLHVISLDSVDIEEIEADFVIVNPGERLDLYLVADQDPAAYIIQAATLELPQQGHPPNAVYGALWYEEDRSFNYIPGDPCQPPCVVVNCPFEQFPSTGPAFVCRNLESMQGSGSHHQGPDSGGNVYEHFLNFHHNVDGRQVINGIQFVLPDKPPQLSGENHVVSPFKCASNVCLENNCKCTHQIDLPLNKMIQLVLVNTDAGKMLHPIHVHGHHFYVTKIGYPSVDPTTREVLNDNVTCNGPRCEWTNPEWSDGRIPEMNLVNSPLKDTVLVPANGYVVIRFMADNPGWWALHCHLELHQAEGMMLVMREGLPQDQNPPPRDFPTCGSFDWSELQFWEKIQHSRSRQRAPVIGLNVLGGVTTATPDISALWEDYKVLIIVVSAVTLVLLVIVVILGVYCCKLTKARSGYKPLR